MTQSDKYKFLYQLTQTLMSIDSTTGQEYNVAKYLCEILNQQGYHVQTQIVDQEKQRFNVFAHQEQYNPYIVFSTHMDCVPPFIPPQETDSEHLGRGACDAKGIIAAMIEAGNRLKEQGHHAFGFLFVVGEETDSIGAKTFAQSPLHSNIRFIINGEPTDNQMACGQKGVLAFKIKSVGQAGHSAYPELFNSAIHPLVTQLHQFLQHDWPIDSKFGKTTANIGIIQGGRAGNVIADKAEASVVMRLSANKESILKEVKNIFTTPTQLEVLTASNPTSFYTLKNAFIQRNEPSLVVGFGSDAPHLSPIAQVLLIGPGSIHVAHTEHEHLKKEDQIKAVHEYINLYHQLMNV